MKLTKITLALIVYLISFAAMAETDLSAIEEQERAQIISELSYRLDTKQNCSATLIWDDAGSGADKDGYFFLPNASNSEFIIGGHASQKRRSKYHCVTTVNEAANNPKGTPPLLVAPADWKQVWKDSGSGATRDGSFWNAIPPDSNYVCIGSVAQLNHNAKPNLSNYRCVHKSLTDKITTSAVVWSDKGSGADKQVTILNLPNTTTFVAVSPRTAKVETYELKKNASSVPDSKKVEEILAQRMAPIKADIEAKTKALEEQQLAKKRAAKEAEAQKIAAEKKAKEIEEQKNLAAAEEKKQEVIQENNEEKLLAAKVAEQKKIEEEAAAKKLKEEQQARIAKAMAEKEAADEVQVEESNKEVIALEAVQESVEKEIEVTEPEAMATTDSSESGSKGLNDILMFFLKIFGMMVGGVIIFMIAFKVLFGKKSSKE